MDLYTIYRRRDWPFVVLLTRELTRLYGYNVFIDYLGIDNANFVQSLLSHLAACDIALLVVTEHTLAPDRIIREDDWVRREIATALDHHKPIILVLVNNTALPPASNLPQDIRAIVEMQGIPFYQEFFDTAARSLAEFVDKVSASSLKQPLLPPYLRMIPQDVLQDVLRLLEIEDYTSLSTLLAKLAPNLDGPIEHRLEAPSLQQLICEKLTQAGQYAIAGQRTDKVIEIYQLLAQIDSSHADMYIVQMGDYYLDSKNYIAAERLYSRAHRLNSKNPDALMGMSICLLGMATYERSESANLALTLSGALDLIERAIVIAPERFQGWNQKGILLLRASMPDAALYAFNQALRLSPNNPFILENKRAAFERLGRFKEAEMVQHLLRSVLSKGD